MKNIKVYKDYVKSLNENLRVNKVRSLKDWLYESSMGDPLRSQVMSMSKKDVLEKADKIVQLTIQKIYNHYPYFRPFLNIMPPTPVFGAGSKAPDGMGTMSTSGSAIFYDPCFVLYTYLRGKSDFASEMKSQGNLKPFRRIKEGLRDPSDYCTFVIIHEIMHNSLKHFLRQIGESKYLSARELHQLWNLATDYEINHILKRDPRTSLVKMWPGGVIADDKENSEIFHVDPSEKDEAGNSLQEFFMTSRAEKIFWRLVQNIENKIEEELKDQESRPEEGQNQPGEAEGQEGDSDGDGGSGQGDGDGDGPDGGDAGDGDGEASISVGDIIWDNTSGTYGKVTSKSGDSIEYDEMSEEDAMSQLGVDNNPGDEMSALKNMLNDL